MPGFDDFDFDGLLEWEEKSERDYFHIEIKADSVTEEGTFEGYLSVFGVVDSYSDIVDKGAFKKTIKENKGNFPLLWMHSSREPIGVFKAHEDEKGLKIKGVLDLEVQRAREVHSMMKSKEIDGEKVAPIVNAFSIGFTTIKSEFEEVGKNVFRHLKEVRLWEGSAITRNFQATPGALLTSVKSIVPFQNLPLADEGRAWSESAAKKRIAKWAGATNGLDTEEIREKYGKAFALCDKEKADTFEGYKLLVADVVEGKLTAIPRGIYAAAAAVQGGRGGTGIADADLARAKSHLGRYYAKLDRTSPWDKSVGDSLEGALAFAIGETVVARTMGTHVSEKILDAAIEELSALRDELGEAPTEPEVDDLHSKGNAEGESGAGEGDLGKSVREVLDDMKATVEAV